MERMKSYRQSSTKTDIICQGRRCQAPVRFCEQGQFTLAIREETYAMNFITRLQRSRAPAETLLIRVAVGCIFLSEGIQKFLLPGQLGAGRFQKIGIPLPEILAPFVASFEIG